MPSKNIPKEDVYCTSFCNHGHRLSNGHPVNHECYVLVPESLALEKAGKVDEAVKLGIRTDRILNPSKAVVI